MKAAHVKEIHKRYLGLKILSFWVLPLHKVCIMYVFISDPMMNVKVTIIYEISYLIYYLGFILTVRKVNFLSSVIYRLFVHNYTTCHEVLKLNETLYKSLQWLVLKISFWMENSNVSNQQGICNLAYYVTCTRPSKKSMHVRPCSPCTWCMLSTCWLTWLSVYVWPGRISMTWPGVIQPRLTNG